MDTKRLVNQELARQSVAAQRRLGALSRAADKVAATGSVGLSQDPAMREAQLKVLGSPVPSADVGIIDLGGG